MMRRLVAVEALFNGRHFDRQIIILCVSWYTSFKLSFRPGGHNGGTRHLTRSHDHPALGPALLAGIREALEALRSASRRILEDG